MKQLFTLAFLLAFSLGFSQLVTPDASPFAKVEQRVGLTDITIEYSRPSIKGREIYGNLVPFNVLWRTGANARTNITFSTDAVVGGKSLSKGTYALFTIPGQQEWEIIFYTEYQGVELHKSWKTIKWLPVLKQKLLKLLILQKPLPFL